MAGESDPPAIILRFGEATTSAKSRGKLVLPATTKLSGRDPCFLNRLGSEEKSETICMICYKEDWGKKHPSEHSYEFMGWHV